MEIINHLMTLTKNILTNPDYRTVNPEKYAFDKIVTSSESSIEYLRLMGFKNDENDDDKQIMKCIETPSSEIINEALLSFKRYNPLCIKYSVFFDELGVLPMNENRITW